MTSTIMRCDVIIRSAGDVNDDKFMNLPSFLEAFSTIITQLSQVHTPCSAATFSPNFFMQCNTIYKFVTCTVSVVWQNRRLGQSLVAYGRVKKQQQNNVFLTYI